MQPIGRDRHAELPIAVEQRIADFGVNNVLTVGAVANKDDTPAHPYQTSMDIASLAPKAEVTVYPWKEPPELKARTIERVRTFLKAHQPATAAR
jgi:hypothetical protein